MAINKFLNLQVYLTMGGSEEEVKKMDEVITEETK